MDMSNVSFNKNRQLEASARDAASGMRLLMLAVVAGVVGLAVEVASRFIALPLAGIVSMVLFLVSVGAGMYGSYLAATALGWASYITVAILLCAVLPLLKELLFSVLILLSINLVRSAGFEVSLYGPLRKRSALQPHS